MRRRRWPWLAFALALFGLASWLMSQDGENAPDTPTATEVRLPRRMNRAEKERADKRRIVVPPIPAQAPAEEPAPARPQDPVLAALPTELEGGIAVVEVNAIRHAPVGSLLIECLLSRDGGRGLARMRERTGVDPIEDLDRIAVSDDLIIASGHFGNARVEDLFGGPGRPHGRLGTIFEPKLRDGGNDDSVVVGTWGGQMFLFGQSEEDVTGALDRLEGRGLHGPPVLDESQTYGDVYGVFTAKMISKLLPDEQASLKERLQDAADRIELHVDASRDVGVVANVKGTDAAAATDLGKSMGAALALGRLQAQAEGRTELVELMDLARVVPGDGTFRLEMAVPLEHLEEQLQRCVEENEARRAARSGSGDGGASR